MAHISRRRGSLRDVGADLWRHLIAAGCVAGLAFAVPVVSGWVLGDLVPAGTHGQITLAGAVLVAAAALGAVCTVASERAAARLAGRAGGTVQAAVWNRLLQLPASAVRPGDAELIATGVHQALSMVLVPAVRTAMTGVAGFGLLLWCDVPLAMFAAGLLALHGAVTVVAGHRRVRAQRRLSGWRNRLRRSVIQVLRGLGGIRLAGTESHVFARLVAGHTAYRVSARRARRPGKVVEAWAAAIRPLSFMVLFAVMAGPRRDAVPVAGLLTFIAAYAVTLSATDQMARLVTGAIAMRPAYLRARAIRRTPPETQPGARDPGTLSGEIELAAVSFRYPGAAEPVLSDLSLRIRPGESVAVTGPTGSGKSTLLRLLLGLERPIAGTVRYDGVDLADLDLVAVRRQCGVVLQDADPLPGSVFTAICGTGSYSAEEAWTAARLAGLDEDIRRMPMGMQTPVTPDATRLSGGQLQRLAIARALIRRPRILLFDQATSVLHEDVQAVIARNTRRLAVTQVVIAHRRSTLMDADRIVVLSGGRITQVGRPMDVLDRPPG